MDHSGPIVVKIYLILSLFGFYVRRNLRHHGERDGRREVGGVRVGTGHLVAYSSGFIRI